MGPTIFDGDLVIRASERIVEDDVSVNGWLHISQGHLRCKKLCCLGLSIEDGGSLECEELLTNFVEVDNSNNNTSLRASWVRARVVDLVQRGMEEVMMRGDVTADYSQHFGGDLNPSWDYVRGKQVVLAKYFESRTDDGEGPVLFDVVGIRKALAQGAAVFRKPGPLLSLLAREHPAKQARPETALNETLAELMAWLEAHPGPQRSTLLDLGEWVPRLNRVPDEPRREAARVIRHAIKSPKLRDQRDALLRGLTPAEIEEKSSVPKHEQRATARLVRSAKPEEYRRPRPEAWLEGFAKDADTIAVYNNPEIKELPPCIADFEKLVHLAVSGTRLSRIASDLLRCGRLQILNLSGNELESLPEGIGQLRALEILDLESNRTLTQLPDSLCELGMLRQLSLGHTRIEALPEDFGKLSELSYLNLHGCKSLLELPESFFELPKLDSLYLHGTRFRVSTLRRIRQTFPECNFWNFASV